MANLCPPSVSVSTDPPSPAFLTVSPQGEGRILRSSSVGAPLRAPHGPKSPPVLTGGDGAGHNSFLGMWARTRGAARAHPELSPHPFPIPLADGNRYHLRCYMYQARDLIAMDKDSFSGKPSCVHPPLCS